MGWILKSKKKDLSKNNKIKFCNLRKSKWIKIQIILKIKN